MKWLLLLLTLLTACTSMPHREIVWFHNGHEEYVMRNHKAFTPTGVYIPNGHVMTCWVTGKNIGMSDLTRDGRRVFSDGE